MLYIKPSQAAIDFHKAEIGIVLNRLLKDKYILRGKPKKRQYLHNSFIKFLEFNVDALVSGKPKQLFDLYEKYTKLKLLESDKKVIKDFFVNTAYKNFNNIEFLEKINIDTCVYCNRNYTAQLVNDRARAELDHWFPKETYYILAVSFYNLIPSCHSCNHIKHANAPDGGWEKALDNINHPYKEDKAAIFSFTFDYESRLNNPRIVINPKNKKSENTIKFNRLEEIYQSSSNRELKDLLDLHYKYKKSYLEILLKTFDDISISEEEIYRMVFGIEVLEDNFHKRPFSKLKKDVIEELLKK